MTEPATDDVDLHPRFQEMHGCGMTKEVRSHPSLMLARDIEVLGVSSDDLVDPKASQPGTGS